MGFNPFKSADKIKAPALTTVGPLGEEFRNEVYPRFEAGFRGEGMFADFIGGPARDVREAGKDAFVEASRNLPSQIRRAGIPREDRVARGVAEATLNRQYYTGMRDFEQSLDIMKEQDREGAIDQGLSALMQEKRIGASLVGMTNQAIAGANNAPTFASGLAGGLGSAAGWIGGQQGFSQNMSQNTPPAYRFQGGQTNFGSNQFFPSFGSTAYQGQNFGRTLTFGEVSAGIP